MAQNSCASTSDRLHSQPLPEDSATSQALEGIDEMLEQIAADLYSVASMLVGEGEESVRLVEQAVVTADVSAYASLSQARKSGQVALAKASLDAIARHEPDSLAAPGANSGPTTCIPDDDLEAAGVSAEEFERMIAGPDRDRVRAWLAELPTAVRVVFTLRAVAGFNAAETAALLVAHGGSAAGKWSTETVRDTFRQGLCALASQLLHSSTTR